MVVTLDQLQPFSLNPRVTRNPRHDDIKASIRVRGLDAPPTITRRPGETLFVIRNGGNTRLAVLRELWSETHDEKFFRIACLFRPWSTRGEIVTLTGHLAENDLRGNLSFIERALGVEKARELYEAESGAPLNQTDLARRLTGDGYPVSQSQISRMQDAVRFLLPAIPIVLYAGLGRPQIERLTALRRTGSRVCERHAASDANAIDFATTFQEVLTYFDGDVAAFNVQRVQDELIGRLAELFDADYDALALEFIDGDSRHRVLSQEPVFHVEPLSPSNSLNTPDSAKERSSRADALEKQAPVSLPRSNTSSNTESQPPRAPVASPRSAGSAPPAREDSMVAAHIVSQASTTPRLEAIQKTIAQVAGECSPDFRDNAVRAIPVQAGGLHPISDVWYIEPALDVPDRLRAHVAQLAREIAQESGIADQIEVVTTGVGFICSTLSVSANSAPATLTARAILSLLNALSAPFAPANRSRIDGLRLSDDLGMLLQGGSIKGSSSNRLSDEGLVKLFRLIRLSRRIFELEATTAPSRRPAGR